MGIRFRFQDLEVWGLSLDLGDLLFDLADSLESRKFFRIVEQTRAVGMSVSNNIAEGSGSGTPAAFVRYLRIARASVFEAANICFILHRRSMIDEKGRDELLERCDHLARKLSRLMSRLSG